MAAIMAREQDGKARGSRMRIQHVHSGYFGPPPMPCPCCGKAERTSGYARGFTCQCDWNWCKKCFKCSKHCQCAKQPEPKSASDFKYIWNPDGTCGAYFGCFKPGVVLAYDDFSPETATWFCGECWEDLGIAQPMLTIVEDKRQKAGEA